MLFLLIVLACLIEESKGAIGVNEIYKHKGANKWQEGTYASPVFYEIDGNNAIIVSATYWQFFAIDARTGDELWNINTYNNPSSPVSHRFESGIVMVESFYEEGDVVFITGTSNTEVAVWDKDGNLLRKAVICPQLASGSSMISSILVAKTDPSLPWTVIVGLRTTPLGRFPNTWFLDPYLVNQKNLQPLPVAGSQEGANSLGVFGKNHAVGDINGDGNVEIVCGSDDYSVNVWDNQGNEWGVNTTMFYNANNFWSNVIFSKNYVYEFRGWAGSQTDFKPFFAHGISTIIPMKDKSERLIAISGLYSSGFDTESVQDEYHSIFVLNPDRSRAKNWQSSFDHCQPYHKNSNMKTISIAIAHTDLYGDGNSVMIFPCSNGKVYAVSALDQSISYNWPYDLGSTLQKTRFASEVAIFKISGQNPNVVFTTWGPSDETGPYYHGKLIILDYQGSLVLSVDLPTPELDGGNKASGSASGVTLFRYKNQTMSQNLFCVIQTVFARVVLYEITGTSNAEILWQTARGSFLRTGNYSAAHESYPFVKPTPPPPAPIPTGNASFGWLRCAISFFCLSFVVFVLKI